MEDILKNLTNKSLDFGIELIAGLLVLIIGYRIIAFIESRLKRSHRFIKVEPTAKTFLISFMSISLKVLLMIVFLSIVGVPMASLVTVVGSCAVAIGLALQGGLSNIAGSLMILVFKPFKVGDYISANGNEGVVKAITMFYTTITTIDNKIVQMPNGLLSNSNIINYTYNNERRVDIDVSVSYGTDIEKVKKVISNLLDKHELILQDKEKVFRLKKHDNSALVFTLRAWTKTPDYWTVYFDLMESIKKEFDKNHIQIPFNQLDVHMVK